MNLLYSKNSPWGEQPTTEELKELEYTQLEENNGKGGGGGGGNPNTSVPVNGGIGIVLFCTLLWGLYLSKKWKPSRT